jgi:three-Cys-motif partner protein
MTDPAHYDGREQAYVKHSLLEKYLPQWAYRVGREWGKLVYVDAFAGPWQVASSEYLDSSFGVAVASLEHALEGLRRYWKINPSLQAVLLGTTASKRAELETYAAKHRTADVTIDTLQGEFAERVEAIDELIGADKKKAFRFVFLDPKGWAQIPMERMAPFLQSRSCEVLVTLMTRHIYRFLDQPDRADSYRNLFGRNGVLERLQECPKPLRSELAVLEYRDSLKILCGFKYVSCAVVFRPDREEVLYYLMFATNHPKGVEVFKDAEIKAAKIQDSVRIDAQSRKGGQPELPLDGDGQRTQVVNELRERFSRHARRDVIHTLLKNGDRPLPYSELFCVAMAYPLVTPEDLHSWVVTLPGVKLTLGGEKRRTPSPDENKGDYATATDAGALRRELDRS